jgi:hypothetical protein
VADRYEELLGRIASACERMAEDPVIQMETGPPVCPHCGKMNPVVQTKDTGGTGLMAEFVIKATCTNCGNIFYAIPLQYQVTSRITEIPEILQARREISGYERNGNDD